jgi:hypothetical protein
MEELLDSVMSPESVQNLVQTYRPVVSPFLTVMPDLGLLKMPPNEMNDYWDQFDDVILENYEIYKQNLELPLPVFAAIQDVPAASYTSCGRVRMICSRKT